MTAVCTANFTDVALTHNSKNVANLIAVEVQVRILRARACVLRIAAKRRAPHNHLQDNTANRPIVYFLRVRRLAHEEFGRTGPQRAHNSIHSQHTVATRHSSRKPEIAQLDIQVIENEDIGRLQVLVYKALLVYKRYACTDSNSPGLYKMRRQTLFPAFFHNYGKVRAALFHNGYVFHNILRQQLYNVRVMSDLLYRNTDGEAVQKYDTKFQILASSYPASPRGVIIVFC
jgi:hypothetical protein